MAEKEMTPAQKQKREEIVKGMKKGNGKDFEKRYPGRGKKVMYATATKQAMNESLVEYYKNLLVTNLNENAHQSPEELKRLAELEVQKTGLGSRPQWEKDLVANIHGLPEEAHTETLRRYMKYRNSYTMQQPGSLMHLADHLSQFGDNVPKEFVKEIRSEADEIEDMNNEKSKARAGL